jgi:poly(3-hydroxybutyrate) depolymerase
MNAKPRQLMGSSTGRLTARPSDPASTGSLGLRALGLGAGCDGLLYVPASYRPGQPAPLALALHGAGGTAGGALSPLLPLANEAGLILVAPESRRRTWARRRLRTRRGVHQPGT